jgi:hypothetical protein
MKNLSLIALSLVVLVSASLFWVINYVLLTGFLISGEGYGQFGWRTEVSGLAHQYLPKVMLISLVLLVISTSTHLVKMIKRHG